MRTLADKFNGKLAVYSFQGGRVGVDNFYKKKTERMDCTVTQSTRKFWQLSNAGKNVFLVFDNDKESFISMFDKFDGVRGGRASKICRDFQYLG